MIEAYRRTAAERQVLGIPPRPLDAEEVRALCALLGAPPAGEGEFLFGLLRDRVPPGVDPGAEVKAEFLGAVARQARVPDGATVFSTSTRNFDDRMGKGAQVFLGSAELGAVTALLGRLPSPAEYLAAFSARVAPRADELCRPLVFDEVEV